MFRVLNGVIDYLFWIHYFLLFLISDNLRMILLLLLLNSYRLKLYWFVTIRAFKSVIEPIHATFFMENVWTLGHNLNFLTVLEWLQTNCAILVLLENLLLSQCCIDTISSFLLWFFFNQIFIELRQCLGISSNWNSLLKTLEKIWFWCWICLLRVFWLDTDIFLLRTWSLFFNILLRKRLPYVVYLIWLLVNKCF